ncbi:MAG: pirin family protein [Bacillota bacterium]
MERKIKKKVTGYQTQDGAGVKLVRVLGHETIEDFDPILMLDSFDSRNPKDYIAGFPLHPHRGIETISYVYCGKMMHKDSLGNSDTISDGEVQWMTAGSGIQHEEKLPESERLLGVQLWLNMPRNRKMTPPAYHSINNSQIQEVPYEGGKVRVLAGTYKDITGFKSSHLPLDYYDIHIDGGASISVDTPREKSIMLFTLLGEVKVADEKVKEKTAVRLTEGDSVSISNNGSAVAQVLFVSSEALKEPVAWGGPIVMNTQEELRKAFTDLRQGTFLQDGIDYSDK